MIITENIIINGREFVRAYSDKGMMVERDGARYSEAVDPVEFSRQYIETDEPIEDSKEEPSIEEKAQAYDILLGLEE